MPSPTVWARAGADFAGVLGVCLPRATLRWIPCGTSIDVTMTAVDCTTTTHVLRPPLTSDVRLTCRVRERSANANENGKPVAALGIAPIGLCRRRECGVPRCVAVEGDVTCAVVTPCVTHGTWIMDQFACALCPLTLVKGEL